MTTYTVSYTTVKNVLTALPTVGSGSSIGSETILYYAQQAESVINAALAKTYALPITQKVPVLETLTTNMTIHGLLSRRIRLSGKVDDDVLKAFDMSGLLGDIVAGKIPLVTSSGTVIAASGKGQQVWTNMEDYTSTFHEGPWEEMEQDEELLQNIRDERT